MLSIDSDHIFFLYFETHQKCIFLLDQRHVFTNTGLIKMLVKRLVVEEGKFDIKPHNYKILQK